MKPLQILNEHTFSRSLSSSPRNLSPLTRSPTLSSIPSNVSSPQPLEFERNFSNPVSSLRWSSDPMSSPALSPVGSPALKKKRREHKARLRKRAQSMPAIPLDRLKLAPLPPRNTEPLPSLAQTSPRPKHGRSHSLNQAASVRSPGRVRPKAARNKTRLHASQELFPLDLPTQNQSKSRLEFFHFVLSLNLSFLSRFSTDPAQLSSIFETPRDKRCSFCCDVLLGEGHICFGEGDASGLCINCHRPLMGDFADLRTFRARLSRGQLQIPGNHNPLESEPIETKITVTDFLHSLDGAEEIALPPMPRSLSDPLHSDSGVESPHPPRPRKGPSSLSSHRWQPTHMRPSPAGPVIRVHTAESTRASPPTPTQPTRSGLMQQKAPLRQRGGDQRQEQQEQHQVQQSRLLKDDESATSDVDPSTSSSDNDDEDQEINEQQASQKQSQTVVQSLLDATFTEDYTAQQLSDSGRTSDICAYINSRPEDDMDHNSNHSDDSNDAHNQLQRRSSSTLDVQDSGSESPTTTGDQTLPSTPQTSKAVDSQPKRSRSPRTPPQDSLVVGGTVQTSPHRLRLDDMSNRPIGIETYHEGFAGQRKPIISPIPSANPSSLKDNNDNGEQFSSLADTRDSEADDEDESVCPSRKPRRKSRRDRAATSEPHVLLLRTMPQLRYVSLSQEQIAQFRQVFVSLDTDDDGSLNLSQLFQGLSAVTGHSLSSQGKDYLVNIYHVALAGGRPQDAAKAGFFRPVNLPSFVLLSAIAGLVAELQSGISRLNSPLRPPALMAEISAANALFATHARNGLISLDILQFHFEQKGLSLGGTLEKEQQAGVTQVDFMRFLAYLPSAHPRDDVLSADVTSKLS
eukprot:m.133419 g.133419  ORF g.133419 m.133419 type:complete len:855 (+) comp23814_c0_seq1:249-2813(+)